MNVFLFNLWHHGDVVLGRPMISAIRSKYPSLEVLLGCSKEKAYLWEDLGYPIFSPSMPNNSISRHVSTRCMWPCGSTQTLTDLGFTGSIQEGVAHHIWFGTYLDILAIHGMTYKTQVLSFNRAFAQHGLSLDFDDSLKISFPRREEIEVPKNSILVENGQVDSGQSCVPLDTEAIKRLAETFPQYCFLCSAQPGITRSNIIDFSRYNLVQLSQVGDKAIAIISRGSAVHACTVTEKNRNKPKFLCGWVCPWKTLWDNDSVINVKTYDDLSSSIKNFLT